MSISGRKRKMRAWRQQGNAVIREELKSTDREGEARRREEGMGVSI